MKARMALLFVGLSLLSTLLVLPSTATAQGTAFSYQGQLTDSGAPANGHYDFQFAVYNDPGGGAPLAGPLPVDAVLVSNGLFTVTLDFGGGLFDGAPRWLQIEVKTNASMNPYTPLNPLQPLTATPYAVLAGTLGGNLPDTSLAGYYSQRVILNNSSNVFSGTFNGAGSSLSNVNAATLEGLSAASFWRVNGNADTSPGTHFLGTIDNQPLELRVKNGRALRLEPTAGGPNVIGGTEDNVMGDGVTGGTISGGEANLVTSHHATVGGGIVNHATAPTATVGGGSSNQATGESATVGGGSLNSAQGVGATIGGGEFNIASGPGAFVGGGGWDGAAIAGNTASGPATTIGGGQGNAAGAWRATVGGGWGNAANGNASFIGGGISNATSFTGGVIGGGEGNQTLEQYATIGGGLDNTASGAGAFIGGGGWNGYIASPNVASGNASTVGGGYHNTASGWAATVGGGLYNRPSGSFSTVGGGTDNVATNLSATVGGGSQNTASGTASSIGGGETNTASGWITTVGGGYGNTASGDWSVVGGGDQNIASGLHATVGGGSDNLASGDDTTIGGGSLNRIATDAADATICGGYKNRIATNAYDATIGGGYTNFIAGNALGATIGGGAVHTIEADAGYATIGGGFENRIATNAASATIGGGADNTAGGTHSTVPGGEYNVASGQYSFAAGRRAKANSDGSFVWADSQNFDFLANGINKFVVRCTGGAYICSAIDGTGYPIAGVYMNAGDNNWSAISDCNLKENFRPVDGREVLEKLSSLAVTEWNMKAQDPSIRHMGPMAQDFRAAFGLGTDDRTINSSDADGVALAAIQGLNEKLERGSRESEVRSQWTEVRIEKLQAENAELKRTVHELKALVEAMNHKLNGGAK